MAKSYTKQRAPEDIVEMADHSDAGAALFIFLCIIFLAMGFGHCYLEAADLSHFQL